MTFHLCKTKTSKVLIERNHPSSLLRGFTLVELLVVIAIIGVLVALLLPAIQAAREAARRSTCLNHVKQIGLAVQNYESAQQQFPSGELKFPDWDPNISVAGYCWATVILPYLENQALYDQLDSIKPGVGYGYSVLYTKDPKHLAMSTIIPTYLCPSSSHPPTHSYDSTGFPHNNWTIMEYVGIAGSDRWGTPYTFPADSGTFYHLSKTSPKDITDGLSNTMMVGEYSGLAPGQQYTPEGGLERNSTTWNVGCYPYGEPHSGNESGTFSVRTVAHPPNTQWYYLTKNSVPPLGASTVVRAALKSAHPGGIHALMCDGSVQFLNDDIDIVTLQDLADREDSNVGS